MEAFEDWDLWLRCSSHTDFLRVRQVTSMYRVPASGRDVVKRQKILDCGLRKVEQTKHLLESQLDEKSLGELHAEIERLDRVFGISTSYVRRIILKYRFLQPIYGWASKMALKLQARRS